MAPPYFAVGSIDGSGRIYTFNAASGTGAEVFNTPNRTQTIAGMAYDPTTGVLWVAGGPQANVLALADGGATLLVTVDLLAAVGAGGGAAGGAPPLINDAVVVPGRAGMVAVTDSINAAIYLVPTAAACTAPGRALPPARRVPLTGDWRQVPGFNANGIDWSRAAQTLVVIQSATGLLFAVPDDGVARLVPVEGGPLTFGDGILFDAADPAVLYVLRNRLRTIAVVRFGVPAILGGGRVVQEITDARWSTPTTLAQGAGGLYSVDARFGDGADPTVADFFVKAAACRAHARGCGRGYVRGGDVREEQ
ncbi:hypothetical protein I4F81_004131 [Pyropia yezoensis]|uniref:Uncharacterized protein n=1 Tax=Pyropia yezoensis TaxID=2788 RepID=A0ACC3BUI8_PYRYE|nr:hypothetical protein I4F81_004131 [Neopyropia yezoensis]